MSGTIAAVAEHGDPARLYSTPEAAEMIGAKPATLLSWARSGLLTPSVREGEGKQTRYQWSPEDVEAARAIADEGGRIELAKRAMEHLPESILDALPQAEQHFRLPGEVVAVSGAGIRRVQGRDTVAEMLRRTGPGPLVILR